MSSKTTFRRAFEGFVVALAATVSMAGCAEIEVPLAEPYEPAHLESTGPNQPKRVILTEEAERRIQLQTTLVKTHGADVSVDQTALIYDQKGKLWVFTVIEPLTYMRAAVSIKEVNEKNLAVLSSGPPAGTEVVTVGAIELWGTELEVAGKH
jgi:ketopantoate reductase